MNAITYFKLNSPYEGDITKNCALTGSEVDNNFFTLEGRDVKSVELKDGKIVVNLMNGNKLTTENITEDCVKGLTIDFDEVNGILTVTQNGVTQTITGFATNYNVGDAISVDGTLVGNGLAKSPVGISPVTKTGQYRPVRKIVSVVDGEKLPRMPFLFPGDRYLTVESINDYGYLYNYEGLKKIACRLKEIGSPWRIPTKQDWDDMLNAIEPCQEFRTHNDARSNKFLGKFAGKFLKSKEYWKKATCDCDDEHTCIDYSDNEECSCGRHIPCNPDYCGEYGTCHHRHRKDSSGLDKYGFRVVPAGYANEAKDYMYFKERAYFWTASNHEYRDAYIKAFTYNKTSVLQDIFASDNYLSVRLVKSFNGDNFNEREDILGDTYSTVLMPSLEHGKAIWTSVNISLADCGCDCCCKYVLPNDGQGMEYSKKYFINEWTGKEWLRKELADGESVVVINEIVTQQETGDNCHCGCHTDEEEPVYNTNYTEYRVVKGELVDVARLIYDNIMEVIQPHLDQLDSQVEDLTGRLDAEIERSTLKDAEHDSAINMLTERVDALETNTGNLAEELAQEKAEREAKDAELEQAIADEAAAREAKDAELEQAIADEAAAREAKDTELEQAIADEAAAREAKDAELEQAIADEKAEREAKDAELEAAIQAEAEAREQAIADEAAAREAKDTELEQAIADEAAAREQAIADEKAEREAKDTELEGMMLAEEGTEFDSENGILTLKSKEGTNDIEVQFSFNFGTF